VFSLFFSDADEGVNAEIKYIIIGNDASDFFINPDDGTITTASALDYETKKIYMFTVVARDQGSGNRHGQTTVTVNVLDINDNAPSFVGTPYVANVKENAGPGTHVIDVNATDSDSGMWCYSFPTRPTLDGEDFWAGSGNLSTFKTRNIQWPAMLNQPGLNKIDLYKNNFMLIQCYYRRKHEVN
jgi:hypothetical protein